MIFEIYPRSNIALSHNRNAHLIRWLATCSQLHAMYVYGLSERHVSAERSVD